MHSIADHLDGKGKEGIKKAVNDYFFHLLIKQPWALNLYFQASAPTYAAMVSFILGTRLSLRQ
jgi:hypothetical protein